MNPSAHLTQADYDQLLRGELPPRRLIQQLFEHLLSRCPRCRAEWHRHCAAAARTGPPEPDLAELPRGADGPEAFDELVRRAIGRVQEMHRRVEAEKRGAELLYEGLKGIRRQEERVNRIRRSERFQSWALCEVLLRKSRAKSFHSPTEAAEMAELAVEVAWALDRQQHSGRTLSDLLARGWALLGNARRVGSDLPVADDTFLMAEFFLQQGTGDPMVIAEVLDLLSSLRRDQHRLAEATHLLVQVIRIYRRAGESLLEGRAYLSLATVLGEAEDHERALKMVERALERVAGEDAPRVALCCHHARTRLILKMGRSEEAHGEMQRLTPLYATFPEPLIQLRRLWLEGEILEALGRTEDAEAAYREVRAGFARLEIPFDAALASLNLATLTLAQGRRGETWELIDETLAIFRSLDVHREACAALELVQRRLRRERVTVEVLHHLYRYLKRARRDPRLKFHPPSVPGMR
jgi:tetratricopeptide (TPR) repeat protein